jgi:hypothetical protein
MLLAGSSLPLREFDLTVSCCISSHAALQETKIAARKSLFFRGVTVDAFRDFTLVCLQMEHHHRAGLAVWVIGRNVIGYPMV